MNIEIVQKYTKDKEPTTTNGNVEEYGKLNVELLVKLLLKSKYIIG